MWTYHQATGNMMDAAGNLLCTGYSGTPAAKNDPNRQCEIEVGPLPRGLYTIEEPRDMHPEGPYVLPLQPDHANQMCHRSGFLIHGDKESAPGTASKGCIILGPSCRHDIWQSGDHQLQVVR